MRYLVTAALPYANGPVHIGHLAGCYLPADIYVRYLRLKNEDVLFISGSDEHGVPITIKARKEGVTPQQVVDKYHAMMRDSFKEFGIAFNHYSRTSSPLHHKTAAEFFKTLYDKGVFKEEVTQQYYDEEVKQFLADRYIEGTCPKCGNDRAYGDQCENCGTSLQPTDLINPRSKLSGSKPVLKETKNWFLPMDDIQKSAEFQEYIKRFDNWKPNIKGQCMSWLNDGLQSRAMTRDLDWGVPVPLPNTEGKVLYVWFDAPIGYISATKEYFEKMEEGRLETEDGRPETKVAVPPTPSERAGVRPNWKAYWQSPDSKLIHFIGKDNIVFHSIIFPMMLMQHGEYELPTNVPANEFLNLEGDKISTSRNWAVWLHEYLENFKGKQDVLRYVLTSIAPETKDSDFSWKDFQARNNSELVAILGNFVNRTLVLTQKFYDGEVPQPSELNDADKACIEAMKNAPQKIGEFIERFRFRDALIELMNLARIGNKYLADNEPWKLIKTDEVRTKTVMYISLEITAYLAALSEPFLPTASHDMLAMLNMNHLNWNDVKGQLLQPGHKIGEVKLLFEKIEDDKIQQQIDKLQATKEIPAASNDATTNAATETVIDALKPETTFDDFTKMDLRIATITAAERVPKTDKLLKLTLDLGFETRTVVSGIAHCFEPEKIIGQQVTLLANLQPRKIKGIESKGMILMADDGNGKLQFVAPSEVVTNGGKVS